MKTICRIWLNFSGVFNFMVSEWKRENVNSGRLELCTWGTELIQKDLMLLQIRWRQWCEHNSPQNVQELHSFLELLNYYPKFLSNLASLLQPLNSLLQQLLIKFYLFFLSKETSYKKK